MSEYLTIKELAAKLKVSALTIQRWKAKNAIPFTVLPGGNLRFDPVEIEMWLEKRTIKARPIGR